MSRTYAQAREDVDHVVDRLGTPIDNGIKPLVASLWAHGIETTGSCGGHDEPDRLAFPWIDIEASNKQISLDPEPTTQAIKLGEELQSLTSKTPGLELYVSTWIDGIFHFIRTGEKYNVSARASNDTEVEPVKTAMISQLNNLMSLLKQFYEVRPRRYDQLLIPAPLGPLGAVRLIWVNETSASLQRKNDAAALRLAQAEFTAFGEFLKDKP